MQASNSATILIAEEKLDVRLYFQAALTSLGYSVEIAQDGDEVLSSLQSGRTHIRAVLLGWMLPKRQGIETLREIRKIDRELPVIMISAASSQMDIVAAMKHGATDFLEKPMLQDELGNTIGRYVGRDGCNGAPPRKVSPAASVVFLGNDPRMREIQSLLTQIGWSEAPVLIQGETGSGKEVVARELHARSPRANNVFLKLNCAALPSELVESELFGYVRGAFTGAFQAKTGMFENADGGALLLDEIGDMDVRLQAKLLQVLQDGSFQRIGGKETIKVDVRIMAATHRDLEDSIRERTFREDLYYRLNVINIHLPPLRERKSDLLSMTRFLMERHAVRGAPLPEITPRLERAMMAYHWPGNVRELENCVRKFLIFRDPEALAGELHTKAARKPAAARSAGLPAVVVDASGEASRLQQVVKAKERAETEAILSALNATRWNRKRAAALLKIDYKALLYKMKKLGIENAPVTSVRAGAG